ncbi:39S ribosomal protein L20, mitochondrial [Acyrthosiphon pisum]|uniref:Large ribosomal subunit protein bL20m n=1 Tax=Acyrthosiphon pisum TaxID=7029 RepID=C4WV71_ACYPI|nr:39S ribosomal protein L20, mitochondrial [Acyrthosiphon pisum]BAH71791.1 ACYPI007336 [Acyrthosiphon pisum]|eukprot:NP_001155704.1 39S ribosomal protein L20, mitochondrial [Acyrthosiphon pisum]
MVFTTAIMMVRSRGPDEFWRKRKIFKIAAHFSGRRRNCYSIAIKAVHRALQFATIGRTVRKTDMIDLWNTRIKAGCEEHGVEINNFKDSLSRCDIQLNKKVLADLAIWEPNSFKALSDLAKSVAIDYNLPGTEKYDKPSNVITRGLLKK